MKLIIKNGDQLNEWFNRRRMAGHDCRAVKGLPPKGATYEDGDLILGKINVKWEDVMTGETIDIEYDQH